MERRLTPIRSEPALRTPGRAFAASCGGTPVGLSSLRCGGRHQPHLPALARRVDKRPITQGQVLRRRLRAKVCAELSCFAGRVPQNENSATGIFNFSGQNVRSKRLLLDGSASIEFPSRIEMVEIEERVEDEEVAADRRTPPHGIVGKENDVSFPQRHVHDNRTLRYIISVEKARREKIALIAETQYYPRSQRGRNYRERIPHLLVGHWCRLPGLHGPALRHERFLTQFRPRSVGTGHLFSR